MLRRIGNKILTFFLALETGSSHIAAGVIMLMTFITTADVIGRYVLKSPILGVYEVSEILLVAIVFLSLSYVQFMKGHVKVDVVTLWMSERARLALDILGYIVGILLMAVITWQSGALAWKAWVTQDHTMGIIYIPLWPGKSLIPIGAGMLCLRLIGDVVSNLAYMRRGVSR